MSSGIGLSSVLTISGNLSRNTFFDHLFLSNSCSFQALARFLPPAVSPRVAISKLICYRHSSQQENFPDGS